MVCMLKIELITINTFVNIDIYGTYYEKKNFFSFILGILGFSQGSCLLSVLCALREQGIFLCSVAIIATMSFIYRPFF